VRRRVEAGADLAARDEEYGKTPLEWAEMGKQPAVVEFLRGKN
jgi:ankyrin repeat protein